MPREDTLTKARRLVAEGRLRVRVVDPDQPRVWATCQGDTAGRVYNLGLRELDGVRMWECSCPARTACSHLRALWLVVHVPEAL